MLHCFSLQGFSENTELYVDDEAAETGLVEEAHGILSGRVGAELDESSVPSKAIHSRDENVEVSLYGSDLASLREQIMQHVLCDNSADALDCTQRVSPRRDRYTHALFTRLPKTVLVASILRWSSDPAYSAVDASTHAHFGGSNREMDAGPFLVLLTSVVFGVVLLRSEGRVSRWSHKNTSPAIEPVVFSMLDVIAESPPVVSPALQLDALRFREETFVPTKCAPCYPLGEFDADTSLFSLVPACVGTLPQDYLGACKVGNLLLNRCFSRDEVAALGDCDTAVCAGGRIAWLNTTVSALAARRTVRVTLQPPIVLRNASRVQFRIRPINNPDDSSGFNLQLWSVNGDTLAARGNAIVYQPTPFVKFVQVLNMEFVLPTGMSSLTVSTMDFAATVDRNSTDAWYLDALLNGTDCTPDTTVTLVNNTAPVSHTLRETRRLDCTLEDGVFGVCSIPLSGILQTVATGTVLVVDVLRDPSYAGFHRASVSYMTASNYTTTRLEPRQAQMAFSTTVGGLSTAFLVCNATCNFTAVFWSVNGSMLGRGLEPVTTSTSPTYHVFVPFDLLAPTSFASEGKIAYTRAQWMRVAFDPVVRARERQCTAGWFWNAPTSAYMAIMLGTWSAGAGAPSGAVASNPVFSLVSSRAVETIAVYLGVEYQYNNSTYLSPFAAQMLSFTCSSTANPRHLGTYTTTTRRYPSLHTFRYTESTSNTACGCGTTQQFGLIYGNRNSFPDFLVRSNRTSLSPVGFFTPTPASFNTSTSACQMPYPSTTVPPGCFVSFVKTALYDVDLNSTRTRRVLVTAQNTDDNTTPTTVVVGTGNVDYYDTIGLFSYDSGDNSFSRGQKTPRQIQDRFTTNHDLLASLGNAPCLPLQYTVHKFTKQLTTPGGEMRHGVCVSGNEGLATVFDYALSFTNGTSTSTCEGLWCLAQSGCFRETGYPIVLPYIALYTPWDFDVGTFSDIVTRSEARMIPFGFLRTAVDVTVAFTFMPSDETPPPLGALYQPTLVPTSVSTLQEQCAQLAGKGIAW